MLGTYSMSSEGLDVKELNTVIFASPKSDITQSIGRILRMITETVPTAYDIIDDSIPVFKRQSIHRKRFYKKNNYNMIMHDVLDENNSVSNMLEQYNSNISKTTKYKKKKKINEEEILNSKCFV